ncbi:hypothetical protein B2J93_5576 [Marssonina coronariae]|uniref:Uncharacterized protein n=1 Tax=Diplocarpon coronariae TaxID=2795749 RepID=A0A218Z222_9HELO|nr:hypothetical protein B2J93_5576 [Marssonina coronariae]
MDLARDVEIREMWWFVDVMADVPVQQIPPDSCGGKEVGSRGGEEKATSSSGYVGQRCADDGVGCSPLRPARMKDNAASERTERSCKAQVAIPTCCDLQTSRTRGEEPCGCEPEDEEQDDSKLRSVSHAIVKRES